MIGGARHGSGARRSAGGRPRPGIGRPAFFIFLGVVALAVAQLGWWIYFLTKHARDPRHAFMFASEGTVFMLALIAGIYLIYRTLLEQVRLRQQRATLLSAVTHELKSPLASIRLLIETIAEGRVDERKRRDLLAKMLIDVDRLERLVRDLLRAGQLETHALELRPERVDLAEVVSEVVGRARARLADPDRIELRAPDPSLAVEGDRELLRCACENIVDNAIKYSRPPRAIAVSVARGQGGEVVLEVRDNGIGLDREALRGIFEPFFRAGDEETRAAKGTGLGLFLVGGIMEAHGGRCEVESEGPGRGTRVRCIFPKAAASPEPGAASLEPARKEAG